MCDTTVVLASYVNEVPVGLTQLCILDIKTQSNERGRGQEVGRWTAGAVAGRVADSSRLQPHFVWSLEVFPSLTLTAAHSSLDLPRKG